MPKRRSIPRPVYFETTIPVVRPCRRCAVWLAAGVSEGLHVEAEFVVLDPGQSVLAVLLGLRLFALRRTGLIFMDDWRLQDPAFDAYIPEHRCGVKWECRITGAGDIRPVKSDTPPY